MAGGIQIGTDGVVVGASGIVTSATDDQACCCCVACASDCLKVTIANLAPGPVPGPVDGDYLLQKIFTSTICERPDCGYNANCALDIDYGDVHITGISIFVRLSCLGPPGCRPVEQLHYVYSMTVYSDSIAGFPAVTTQFGDIDAADFTGTITLTDADTGATFTITLDRDCETDSCDPYIDVHCDDCCPDTECITLTAHLLDPNAMTDYGTVDLVAHRIPDTCYYLTTCSNFAEDSPFFGGIVGVFAHAFCRAGGALVLDRLTIGFSYHSGSTYRDLYWTPPGSPVIEIGECTGSHTFSDLAFQSTFQEYPADATTYTSNTGGGTVDIEFTETCPTDGPCGEGGCSVDCIECDDCPPYCPDDGATWARTQYLMISGSCGVCGSGFEGFCGFCCDCDAICGECGHAGPTHCPCYPINTQGDCETAGHSWYCDPDCVTLNGNEGEANSPCSQINVSGIVDLPLTAHTSTTMTFSDTFLVGGHSVSITAVFDCTTKTTTWTVSTEGGQCTMDGTSTGDCDSLIDETLYMTMHDTVLETTCSAIDGTLTHNGIEINSAIIHRELC